MKCNALWMKEKTLPHTGVGMDISNEDNAACSCNNGILSLENKGLPQY